jgi:hypothetical protein
VCGKLLTRSILVLLFRFEVPWKNKKIQQQKETKKEAKKAKNTA